MLKKAIHLLSQYGIFPAPVEPNKDNAPGGCLCGNKHRKGEKVCSKCGKEILADAGDVTNIFMGQPLAENFLENKPNYARKAMQKQAEKWNIISIKPAKLYRIMVSQRNTGDQSIRDLAADFREETGKSNFWWSDGMPITESLDTAKALKKYYERLVGVGDVSIKEVSPSAPTNILTSSLEHVKATVIGDFGGVLVTEFDDGGSEWKTTLGPVFIEKSANLWGEPKDESVSIDQDIWKNFNDGIISLEIGIEDYRAEYGNNQILYTFIDAFKALKKIDRAMRDKFNR